MSLLSAYRENTQGQYFDVFTDWTDLIFVEKQTTPCVFLFTNSKS